jgi:hypothetical protein
METTVSANRPLPKLALIGRGRAGKDEAGAWLTEHTHLKSNGATSIHLLPHVVWAKYGLRPGYLAYPDLARQAYVTRHDDRMFWFELGVKLRNVDPGILVRPALEGAHLLIGCRDPREIEYARAHQMVDLVAWVERAAAPPDPTVNFGPALADVVIENNGSLAEFHGRLANLCRFSGIPLYTGSTSGNLPLSRSGRDLDTSVPAPSDEPK